MENSPCSVGLSHPLSSKSCLCCIAFRTVGHSSCTVTMTGPWVNLVPKCFSGLGLANSQSHSGPDTMLIIPLQLGLLNTETNSQFKVTH